jgi:hypothetical protein
VIIEVDDPTLVGQDRRRAMAVVFTLCLALGSAFVGRDSPLATSEVGNSTTEAAPTMMWVDRGGTRWWGTAPAATVFDGTLSLPADTIGVQLQVFPDWLANEQLPPMQFVPVRVRAGSGLAVEAARPGDPRIVTWTERGAVYWLLSDSWGLDALVRLANTLR